MGYKISGRWCPVQPTKPWAGFLADGAGGWQHAPKPGQRRGRRCRDSVCPTRQSQGAALCALAWSSTRKRSDSAGLAGVIASTVTERSESGNRHAALPCNGISRKNGGGGEGDCRLTCSAAPASLLGRQAVIRSVCRRTRGAGLSPNPISKVRLTERATATGFTARRPRPCDPSSRRTNP